MPCMQTLSVDDMSTCGYPRHALDRRKAVTEDVMDQHEVLALQKSNVV